MKVELLIFYPGRISRVYGDLQSRLHKEISIDTARVAMT
jgi:hypothetical protein